MTTLTRGATRADGFRFWSYAKHKGGFREKWYSPAAYKRANITMNKAVRRWRNARAAVHYSIIGLPACGHTAHHLTGDSDAVTCNHCKKWLTMWKWRGKVTP